MFIFKNEIYSYILKIKWLYIIELIYSEFLRKLKKGSLKSRKWVNVRLKTACTCIVAYVLKINELNMMIFFMLRKFCNYVI